LDVISVKKRTQFTSTKQHKPDKNIFTNNIIRYSHNHHCFVIHRQWRRFKNTVMSEWRWRKDCQSGLAMHPVHVLHVQRLVISWIINESETYQYSASWLIDWSIDWFMFYHHWCQHKISKFAQEIKYSEYTRASTWDWNLLLLKRFRDCIRSERTLYKSFLHYIDWLLYGTSAQKGY